MQGSTTETAMGDYPVQVVQSMSRVCLGAERHKISVISAHRVDSKFDSSDEAIAMATMYTANHLNGVRAIICLTESGATPLWMSRIRSGIPIYALTRHQETRQKVAMFRGVEAIPYDATSVDRKDVNRLAVKELESRNLVNKGDLVILTKGEHMGIDGGTNAMKILTVGNVP